MGERITFRCNGTMTPGYLARPAAGRGPGIVVVQEWWGLVPQIERVADRFAAEGLAALAPDLYHGESTKSPDQAGKLMMASGSDDNEARPEVYDAAAADDAWTKTLAFFRRELGA